MIEPMQLLTDFLKDILETTKPGGDPLQRQALVGGYAKTIEAMLEAARKGEEQPKNES